MDDKEKQGLRDAARMLLGADLLDEDIDPERILAEVRLQSDECDIQHNRYDVIPLDMIGLIALTAFISSAATAIGVPWYVTTVRISAGLLIGSILGATFR